MVGAAVAWRAMLSFLSAEWIGALHEAAVASTSLAELTAGVTLVIEQEIVDAPGGPVTYHVLFEDGVVAVRSGPSSAGHLGSGTDRPTIRFSQDLETATEIAAGRGSAQRAFMTGRLRVGGDLSVLLARGDLLAELDDVFGAVRARTDLGGGRARTP